MNNTIDAYNHGLHLGGAAPSGSLNDNSYRSSFGATTGKRISNKNATVNHLNAQAEFSRKATRQSEKRKNPGNVNGLSNGEDSYKIRPGISK